MRQRKKIFEQIDMIGECNRRPELLDPHEQADLNAFVAVVNTPGADLTPEQNARLRQIYDRVRVQ